MLIGGWQFPGKKWKKCRKIQEHHHNNLEHQHKNPMNSQRNHHQDPIHLRFSWLVMATSSGRGHRSARDQHEPWPCSVETPRVGRGLWTQWLSPTAEWELHLPGEGGHISRDCRALQGERVSMSGCIDAKYWYHDVSYVSYHDTVLYKYIIQYVRCQKVATDKNYDRYNTMEYEQWWWLGLAFWIWTICLAFKRKPVHVLNGALLESCGLWGYFLACCSWWAGWKSPFHCLHLGQLYWAWYFWSHCVGVCSQTLWCSQTCRVSVFSVWLGGH